MKISLLKIKKFANNHSHLDSIMKNRKIISRIVILTLLLVSSIIAQEYIPGEIYYGRNNYIEYHAGDVPLIFSAPHGGNLTPSEIPDRTYGTLVTDSYTKETTIAIKQAIYNFTGHYPHLVIVNLKRIKLDANREIIEGAQGNEYAEIAWHEFHDFIEMAEDTVTANYGKGMYVDIHGHGHEIQRLELGYLLSASNLFLPDSQLNSSTYINFSSIRTLASTSSADFASLIRGTKSLGTLFENYGISAIPSSSQPDPGVGNPYFTGGYDTQRHGSSGGGPIDGVQIEAYRDGLRNTASNRAFYAQTITQVFDEYLREHYGWDGIITSVEDEPVTNYEIEKLYIYPNPSNPSTNIKFNITSDNFVNVYLYNSIGQRMENLASEYMTKGEHNLFFDGGNYASGIYFVVLQSGILNLTQKLVLLK